MTELSAEALTSIVSKLMTPGQAKATETPRQLKRKTTEEGKSYQWYTTLGGLGKAALPCCERAKLLHHLDESVSILQLNTRDAFFLDAAIYLVTGQMPTTRIRSVATDPRMFRAEFKREYDRLQRTN